MAIGVRSNVASLSAQRHLNRTMGSLRGTVEQLSSGFRINKAADDAAGLAISESMQASLGSLQVASRNANDAVSVLQTAESGMDDITGMLHRLRELAMQSASDGVTDTERGYLNTEAGELQAEITRIASDTEFNGTKLLDGSYAAKTFQIGLDSGDTLQIDLSQIDAATLGVDAGSITVDTKANANTALAAIDTALDTINDERAGVGAKQNRLEVISNNIGAQHEALTDAHSRIKDVDIAQATANMTKNQILLQAGSAMLAQANSMPQIALSLLG